MQHASAPGPWSARRRVGGPALAAALLLHLLLAGWLQGALRPARVAPDAAAVQARIELRVLAPPEPAQNVEPESEAEAAIEQAPVPRRRRASVPAALSGGAPAAGAETPIAAPAAEPVSGTAGDAAAAPAERPLLDTDASRRAMREAARAASPHGLPGTSPAASRDERLAQSVGEAARGDCSKGEYAGAGFGLLSLPFLAAAALRGDCSR